MKLGRFAVFAMVLLIGADSAKDQLVRKEISELAGVWRLTRTEFSDGSVEVGRNLCLTIDPDGVVRYVLPDEDSSQAVVAQYEFDPTRTPKRYQVVEEEGGKKVTRLGIYAMEENTLKFCFLADPTKRPGKLSVDKDTGGGDTLLIYKRR